LFFRNPFLIVFNVLLFFLFTFFSQEILSEEQKIFLLAEGAILTFLGFTLRELSLSFCKFYEIEEEEKTVLEIRLAAKTWHLKEERERLKEEVKKRTQKLFETSEKLKERVKELEKFYKLTIGRELKIKELKRKIKELEEKLKKYEH
jgi:C4-dicarboxylate-specific signal transduction histidine kinase